MDINTDDTVFQSDEGVRKFNSRTKRQFKRKITLMHLLKVICASRETCLEWLKNKGLLPRILFCPKCNKKMKFEPNEEAVDGYIWICKECASSEPQQFSSRHGSWLEGKNAPLVDILVFTYLWSHGYTEMQICKETNMPLSVVQEWSEVYSSICEASIQRKRSCELELGESSSLETKESSVAAWRRKNKYKDPFIEFLKEADAL